MTGAVTAAEEYEADIAELMDAGLRIIVELEKASPAAARTIDAAILEWARTCGRINLRRLRR